MKKNARKKILILTGGLLLLTGLIAGIFFIPRTAPISYRNILGIIESPEQVAKNFLLACQSGNAELMCQYVDPDTRMRFFHTAAHAGQDPGDAMRKLAEKTKFRLRNAVFSIEKESILSDSPDRMSVPVKISYTDNRAEEIQTLRLLRSPQGIWHCASLPQ